MFTPSYTLRYFTYHKLIKVFENFHFTWCIRHCLGRSFWFVFRFFHINKLEGIAETISPRRNFARLIPA